MKDEPTRDDGRKRYLTARQLAAVLQVSESTVRRLAREGRIPSVRLTPRLLRFHLDSVNAALEDHANSRSRSRRRPGDDDGAGDSQLPFPGM
ncbi:MAG TPA: helix-turn-helix domain-containing protein [Pyrinomonadaceae bacterium]|nr:helix-turn-helix domain-containing protein [Pyrinomonadaceae bacterium]